MIASFALPDCADLLPNSQLSKLSSIEKKLENNNAESENARNRDSERGLFAAFKFRCDLNDHPRSVKYMAEPKKRILSIFKTHNKPAPPVPTRPHDQQTHTDGGQRHQPPQECVVVSYRPLAKGLSFPIPLCKNFPTPRIGHR